MKIDNPFDRKMEIHKDNMPAHFRTALIETVDTLEFTWAGAQSVFGDQATPEHAIALLQLVMAHTGRAEDREDRDRSDIDR